MNTAGFIFELAGLLLLAGAGYYFFVFQRGGAYPPKPLLIKRIQSLGGVGGIMLLLGSFLSFFSN